VVSRADYLSIGDEVSVLLGSGGAHASVTDIFE